MQTRRAVLLSKRTIFSKSVNVDTVMVALDNNLLIANAGSKVLHKYNADNFQRTEITIQDHIVDISWTPRGNIVYTTSGKADNEKPEKNRLVTTDKTGIFISQQQMTAPTRFSVSGDNTICLTDKVNGIYESKDDGITWTHILRQPNDTTRCWQAIKVHNNQDEVVYWALAESNSDKFCLRRFTLSNGVIWQDIFLPGPDLSLSKMAFDGKENIFLAAYNSDAVLSIPVNNPQNYKYLSFNESIRKLCGINFDCCNQLLYLCCLKTKLLKNRCKMKIFSLFE